MRDRITARVKTKYGARAAGAEKEKHAADRVPRFQIPFTRKNYIAFGVGIALLIVGYICLAQPPVDGFLSLTLAPVLLVLSYCVIFPYAIMARERSVEVKAAPKGD